MKEISIITINKNNAAGLERTIKSVESQNYKNYEFIVIDGNSVDNSINIIKKYENNLSFWISEPDHGIYNAMNKGIKKASGEYCLFLNSGDYLYNEHTLEKLFENNLNSDIVSCNAYAEINHKLTSIHAPSEISFYIFYKHSLMHQATLIKRILFEKYGYYNENLVITSDWEFFLKCLIEENSSYQSIDIFLTVFDTTGFSSQVDNYDISRKERQTILNGKYDRFISDYKLIEPFFVYQVLKKIERRKILQNIFYIILRGLNKMLRN